MKNLKTNWLLKHTLTVFSCVLIVVLGIAFLSHADPVTTTIGENISTNSLTATGLTVNGATSMTADLTVQEAGDAKITIYSNTDSPTADSKLLVVQKGTTPSELFSVDENGDVTVASDLSVDADTFYVDSANNRIGIGTNSPEVKLEIYNGDVNFSSIGITGFAWNNSTRKLGIGVSSPSSPLHIIESHTGQPRGITIDNIGDFVNSGSILLRHARGSADSLEAVQAGDSIGAVCFSGYKEGGYSQHQGIIQTWATEDFSLTNQGTDLTIQLVPKNSGYTVQEVARFTGDRKFGIGTSGNGQVTNTLTVNELNAGGETIPLLLTNPSADVGTAVSLGFSPYGNGVVTDKIQAIRDGTGWSLGFFTWDLSLSLQEHMLIDGTGNIGIGDITPSTKLDVNGIIKTAPASSRTCDTSSEGGIMYDSDDNHFYGCNGISWVRLDYNP